MTVQESVGQQAVSALAAPDTEGFTTLCDMLLRADEARLVFPESGQVLTTGELVERAGGIAAELADSGVGTGSVVGVLGPTSPDFVAAVFGIMFAGAAATLLPVPSMATGPDAAVEAFSGLLNKAGVRLVLTDAATAGLLTTLIPGETGIRLLEVGNCRTGAPPIACRPGPRDPAVVQFSSGSTAAPKGIVLTHEALLPSIRGTLARMGTTSSDIAWQWVPLFHDFGLIGLLSFLYIGLEAHLVNPGAFIRDTAGALRYLAEHRVTIFTGPNFAYDRLVSAARSADGRPDLRFLRSAVNAGEVVRASTMRDFAEIRGKAGVMTPGYGMAEFCVGITLQHTEVVSRTVHVDRSSLENGARVRFLAEADPYGLPVVSQGPPFPGVTVRIVDAAGFPLPAGHVGEIEATGPNLMSGYLGDPEATRERMHAGWFRTGDTGFLHDGELYVTGRIKDVIIVAGRNIHAEDAESIAGVVDGVYHGHCVAVAEPDSERMLVVVETRSEDHDALTTRVRQAISGRLGIGEIAVRAVPRGWLPRTTSGKWRRAEVRERLAAQQEQHG